MTKPGVLLSVPLPRLEEKALRLTTLAALAGVFLVIAVLTALQIVRNDHTNQAMLRNVAWRNEIQRAFVLIQGAETGQRGFLLTGQDKYLAPYRAAGKRLPGVLNQLSGADLDRRELATFTSAIHDKMAELSHTIVLKQAGRSDKAATIVDSGLGYELMTKIRESEHKLLDTQERRITDIRNARDEGLRFTFIIVAALLTMLVLFLAMSMIATLKGLREKSLSLKQLAAAKFEADEANRAKSEFLASMSHELRTPLNAILGFSEVIQTELFGPVGTPQYREYANDIHKSGRHLLELINDVLDLSKISAGKMELHEQEIAISSLIYDSLALVRGRAEHVRLAEEPTQGLPLIWGDNRLLKQILVNLLSNAIKFTPADGTVFIGAQVSCNEIRISVRDTGIGMTPQEIKKAVSPYGQVDSKIARDHQGTGLGLPICSSLAQLHGGSLEISSTPGAGTTVTLTLPASRILPDRTQLAC